MSFGFSLTSFLTNGEPSHDVYYDLLRPLVDSPPDDLRTLLTDHEAWLKNIPPERRGVDTLDYTCLLFRHDLIDADARGSKQCLVQGLPACKSLTVSLDLSHFSTAPMIALDCDEATLNVAERHLRDAINKPISLIVRMDSLTAFLHTEFQQSEHPGCAFFDVLTARAKLSSVMAGREVRYGPTLRGKSEPARSESANLGEFDLSMAHHTQLDFRFSLEPFGDLHPKPCSCLTMVGKVTNPECLDRDTGARKTKPEIEFASMVTTIWSQCPTDLLM